MKNIKFFLIAILSILIIAAASGCAGKNEEKNKTDKTSKPEVILATTTSTMDSGLLDVLLPVFEKETGYKVKPVAVGSGQALEMGKRGEADVLLSHAPKSEKELVDGNIVTDYSLVMHNDFILVGPANDPAKIKGASKTADAFKKIMDTKALFISRGDDSGTHKKELGIWEKAAVKPAGSWYQETGSGMGQTLQVASEKQAYTLTDRATYLATKNNLKLEIILEKEKSLLNIYHVMAVNAEKFPKVNKKGGQAFVEFMLKPATQDIIAGFGKDKYGQALFVADAGKSEDEVK